MTLHGTYPQSRRRARLAAHRGDGRLRSSSPSMGVALFGALDSSAKVSGTAKARAGAAALAQDDQERMRAMPVVDAEQPARSAAIRSTVGKISYIVDSRADWIADGERLDRLHGERQGRRLPEDHLDGHAEGHPGLKPVVVTSTRHPGARHVPGQRGQPRRHGRRSRRHRRPRPRRSASPARRRRHRRHRRERLRLLRLRAGRAATRRARAPSYVDADGNVSGTLTRPRRSAC